MPQPGADDISPIVVEGRRTRLRLPMPEDYPTLYRICTDPRSSFRWRFGLSSVSYDDFCRLLWEGIHLQFVIERKTDGRLAGLHQCYNTSFHDSHTYISVVVDPDLHGAVWPLEGGALFIDFLFQAFAFRKIYGETLEFNGSQVRSGLSDLFVEEVRLREHFWFEGRFWDAAILALYRETWEDACSRASTRYSSRPSIWRKNQ